MRIDVTFGQTDMEIRPTFDKIVRVGDGSVVYVSDAPALAQGTIAGEFVSDEITSLRYSAFYGCKNLTKVSLPNCRTLAGDYTFANCNNLLEIDLPNLETASAMARVFFGLKKVKEISLPELTTAPNMEVTFSNCSLVRKISMPKLETTSFQRYAFEDCWYLHTLILGGTTVHALGNTNAFKGVAYYAERPFYIYVPDELVDSYKTATNWSNFADKIKGISEKEADR